jgi:DNA replication licensing factor MCM2
MLLPDGLIDGYRSGEHVDNTGIYTHSMDYKLTYKTDIVASFVHSHTEQRIQDLTEQDIRDIQHLAKDPRIASRIVQSMVPSIYGRDICKLAEWRIKTSTGFAATLKYCYWAIPARPSRSC